MLRFLRRYLLPFLPWYLAGTALLIVTNWMSVTIPLYLATGVDALGTEDSGQVVRHSAGIVALMGAAIIAVRTTSRVLFFTPGRLVEAAAKRDLFERILRHQPASLDHIEKGDLYSRVSSDVTMLRLIAGFGVLQIVNVVIALVLGGGQMLRISPSLAAWLLLPIVAAMFIVQLFIRRLFLLTKRMQVELASMSDHVLSSYRGIAAIQSFTAEPAFEARFAELNQQYRTTLIQRAEIRALLGPVLALSVAIDVFIILFVGGPMAIAGEVSVGELVALTALVSFVALPLRASSFLISVVKQAQASLERIDAILYADIDRPEGPSGVIPADKAPALELRHLSFTWPDAKEPALHDVHISVPAGSTLGILGLTGSGKSTLLSLITRLRNPPRGTLFVDGVDVLDLDLDLWRERATLVPQRAFLFSESLADNILMCNTTPGLLDDVLERAALSSDIGALSEGIQTEVGETGVRLSGGQRQRTALARGLARSSRLLLLDDVLSAVDHTTEGQLIHSLKQAGHGGQATILLVAHRVSALLHADQVLVLDKGRVVDSGPPQELMDRPGLFRQVYDQQQAEPARAETP